MGRKVNYESGTQARLTAYLSICGNVSRDNLSYERNDVITIQFLKRSRMRNLQGIATTPLVKEREGRRSWWVVAWKDLHKDLTLIK